VLNPAIKFGLPWFLFVHGVTKRSLAGLILAVGLLLSSLAALPVESAESSLSANQSSAHETPHVSTSTADSLMIPDGIYLYGQSPEPDQIGAAYLVFEADENEIVGAFYMPHSSFDCFQGEVQPNRLALTITDSYEQTTHPYEIAMTASSDIASADNPAIAPAELEGYHPIEEISENDQRILAICRNQFQQ
jgi:hypothetical protein